MVGFVAALPAAGPARAAPGPVTVASRPETGSAMIGWHASGDDPDLLRAQESELGTRFALVRMYQQWQLPSRRVAAMISEGRLVLVSHKPPATGWGAVASGAEDGMIQALAEAYRAFGREVLFTFHHEPHDNASDVKGGTSGTAAEYLAGWRRIRSIFDRVGASHSAGGNVFFAYSATASWALKSAPGGPPGSGDPLYPGDALVDVLAHDRYNWASCRNDAWEEFGPEWAPLVALAAAHRKPLVAAEFGSPPAGGARNDWFRNAARYLKTDPLARQWMWGFAYFHTLHDTCPWDFLSHADDGRLGWQDAFRDPYFTGTPFSLASRSSTSTLEGATRAPSPVGVPAAPKPVTAAPKPVTPAPSTSTTTTTRPPTSPTPGPAPTGASPQPGSDGTVPSEAGGMAAGGPGPVSAGITELAAAPATGPGPIGVLPGGSQRPRAGPLVWLGLVALVGTGVVTRRVLTG